MVLGFELPYLKSDVWGLKLPQAESDPRVPFTKSRDPRVRRFHGTSSQLQGNSTPPTKDKNPPESGPSESQICDGACQRGGFGVPRAVSSDLKCIIVGSMKLRMFWGSGGWEIQN